MAFKVVPETGAKREGAGGTCPVSGEDTCDIVRFSTYLIAVMYVCMYGHHI